MSVETNPADIYGYIKSIDYILYFENGQILEENKKREESYLQFLKQLEFNEKIRYEILKNKFGDKCFVLLRASNKRILKEAEKLKLEFLLQSDWLDDLSKKETISNIIAYEMGYDKWKNQIIDLTRKIVLIDLKDAENDSSITDLTQDKKKTLSNLMKKGLKKEDFDTSIIEKKFDKLTKKSIKQLDEITKQKILIECDDINLDKIFKDLMDELRIKSKNKFTCLLNKQKLIENDYVNKIDDSNLMEDDCFIMVYDDLAKYMNEKFNKLLDDIISNFHDRHIDSIDFEKKIYNHKDEMFNLIKNWNRYIVKRDIEDEKEQIKLYARYKESKKEIFCNRYNELTSTVRSMLVDNILNNFRYILKNEITNLNEEFIGLSYMLKRKYFNDSFILHELSRDASNGCFCCKLELMDFDHHNLYVVKGDENDYKDRRFELHKNFIRSIIPEIKHETESFNSFGIEFMPLDQIKDYFGEEIGFYFAWVEHLFIYLLLLSFIGILFFIIGISIR